jgi:hypothetical protein
LYSSWRASTSVPTTPTLSDPLGDLATFPLVDALSGRRSRRSALGDEIPDGPLTYRSRHEPVPLTALERMLVLSAMGGTTGWHCSITRNPRYAPHPADYAGAAAGRTSPSAGDRDHRQRAGHVADIAQHMLAILCFLTQNGYAVFDDVHGREIPGLERFRSPVDVDAPFPLTSSEQYALTEATAELATCCYAGVLVLQAMGLGGWMFDGIDRFSGLGASGHPDVPGLGSRYDEDERWAVPDPTGLPGVFEAFCPPHHPDMAAAVEAFAEREFGGGGPFDPGTPGPWTDSPGFRGSAQVHSEEFKACVTLQAQYVLDTFGRFPGTGPTSSVLNDVQAHHLDLEFYDRFFRPGAYLRTHTEHVQRWHPAEEG